MINEVLFKQKLIEVGMTQRMLSEKSGVTLSTINAIVKGRNTPNVKTISQLCNAMGITDAREKALIFLN